MKLTSELITRIAQENPKGALKELIWNACDADANNIHIKFTNNLLEAVEYIEIEDDGHGIEYDKVDHLFGNLGESQKSKNYMSPKGRIYHGKLGQGRYKGFSLGSKITWNSRYKDGSGVKEFDLECTADNLKKFNLQPQIESSESKTGVKVTIEEVDEAKVNILQQKEDVYLDLLSSFAPYLLAYKDINIFYQEKKLEPQKHIKEEKKTIFEYLDENTNKNYFCTVLIIKWNSQVNKNSYICGDRGVVYEEIPILKSKNIPLSVYIMSNYFDELHKRNLMNPLEQGYRNIYDQAMNIVDEYIRQDILKEATGQIKELKAKKVYPYTGEPINEIDKVERQIFDVVAVEINKYTSKIRSSNKESQKLTYRLIKEALKNQPDSITRILSEVFSLTEEQQDELAELLSFTTLPSIITASKVISDRLLFLNALETMIYDKEVSRPIKERTQLHKILLNELWIFGDKYLYGADDISLKNVLKEYITYMGREEILVDIPKEAIEDLTRIPDICLWQQYPERAESVENLVIELKRPTCILGKKELDQIDDYAYKISQNKIFPKEKTKWTFILVAKDYDEFVKYKVDNKKGEVAGEYYRSEDGNVVILVKRWSDIILENKLKYSFLKDKLKYRIEDNNQGMEYIQRKYQQYFES